MRVSVVLSLLTVMQAIPAHGQEAIAEAMQGTWQAIAVQDGGRTAPPDVVASVQWIVTAGTIAQVMGGEREDVAYTLDVSHSPTWIDLRRGSRVNLGIVRIAGDTLTVCFGEGQGEGRATAFESLPDSPNDVLLTFRRAEP
jgi:uncharacterized protein (TIGR03067 family)